MPDQHPPPGSGKSNRLAFYFVLWLVLIDIIGVGVAHFVPWYNANFR
ncbi:hypothetical protein [Rhodopirellula bahusiensis]